MASNPSISVTITSDDKTKHGISTATANFEGFGSKVSGVLVGVGAKLTEFAASAGQQLLIAAGDWVNMAKQAEVFGKKADTVFGGSSADIKAWADEVNGSFGLSDEAVVGMAASLGDLLKPMGFTEGATADMTKEMLDLAGALSAWSGGEKDAAEVSDIMTKALLGETDGLKALGISISAAEIDARLLAKGQDKLTGAALAQAKAIATQELIMEKSTDAQKAWNDGTMDSVKQQNEAKAAWEDAKTELGQGLLPMVQAATKFLVEDLIPAAQATVAEFKEHWPAIKETVMSVMQPIMDWFVTNWPVIRDTVNEAMTNIKVIIETVLGIVRALWDVFGEYIKTYVQAVFDFIKAYIEAAMNIIKGVIDVVMGLITGDWSRVWDGIKSIVSGVWDAIKAIVQLALDQLKLAMQLVWDGIKAGVQAAWDGIKSLVSDGIDALVGFVKAIPGRIASTLSGAFDGLWEGFKGVVNRIIDAWNNLDFPDISIPGFDPPGPGSIPGVTIPMPGTPNIPRLHSGGIFNSGRGEGLALLQDGERVIARGQSAGGLTVIVNAQGAIGFNPADVERFLVTNLKRYQQRAGIV